MQPLVLENSPLSSHTDPVVGWNSSRCNWLCLNMVNTQSYDHFYREKMKTRKQAAKKNIAMEAMVH